MFALLVIAGAYVVVTPLEVFFSGPSSRSRRANLGIILPVLATSAAADIALLAVSDRARDLGLGLIPWVGIPGPVAVAVTVLVLDLAGYVGHRLRHRNGLLWRFHRSHHTDPDVDVTTLLRMHPVDVAGVGLVNSIAVVLLGAPPHAVAVSAAIGAVFGLWDHARVRFPRRVEHAMSKLVQTPGLHRVHHSPRQSETDSNYGLILSVWDRLFRSFHHPRPMRPRVSTRPTWQTVKRSTAMLAEPWRPLVKTADRHRHDRCHQPAGPQVTFGVRPGS